MKISAFKSGLLLKSVPVFLLLILNFQSLTVRAQGTVTITSTNINCDGGYGSASANPPAGNGPFYYLWSTGATTQSISNLSAGTYSVVVSWTFPYQQVFSYYATGNCTITAPSFSFNPSVQGTVAFSYAPTIQSWTVPANVTQITITGQGGSGAGYSGNNTTGGFGATMSGLVSVTPGDVLKIVTGGAGSPAVACGGGGGGGTFIWDFTSNTLLLAAGGGGGGNYCCFSGYNANILTSTNPVANGGTGEGGGAAVGSDFGEGGGGAGFLQNGANQTYLTAGNQTLTLFNGGGNDMANGFTGGPGYNTTNNGGFGGGGGGGNLGGGGGGGYNGGASGDNATSIGGAGGSSYVNGQILSYSAVASGNGNASISYTSGISITNVSCYGNHDGSASVNMGAGYTYLWSNGMTTSSITNLFAATYSLTITNTGNGECHTYICPVTQPEQLSLVTPFSFPYNFSGPVVQKWAVPPGVTSITITAAGGCSGLSGNGPSAFGAIVTGVVTVTPGDSIDIIAGGAGEFIPPYSGGGGGTYVYKFSSGSSILVPQNTTLLMAAGGAGGTGTDVSDPPGNGQTNMANLTSPTTDASNYCASGGYGGNGGGDNGFITGDFIYSYENMGSGGAGWLSDGQAGEMNVGNGPEILHGGSSPFNHSNGGVPQNTQDDNAVLVGGYGGGGATIALSISEISGGGGGGYNGGGGGGEVGSSGPGGGGGGGGSYCSGRVSSTSLNTNYNGEGYVIIYSPSVAGSLTVIDSDIQCVGEPKGIITAAVVGGQLPYTYSWSPGGGTSSVDSNLGAGTYTLTVTDGACGTLTVSATITNPVELSAISPHITVTNATCTGSSNGSATANPTGTSPFFYSWSGSSGYLGNTSSISNLSAGTYTLNVDDEWGDCTYSVVTIASTDSITGNVQATNISCNGGLGSALSLPAFGVSPYTYEWSTGATTSAISKLTPGSYSLTVRDRNGCSSPAVFTITQPAVPLSAYSPKIFGYVPSIQSWTVPNGVTQLTVTANGGAGGGVTIVNFPSTGGNGADITGIVSVTPGDVLNIVTGGAAPSVSDNNAPYGGGGGGTFIWDSTANVLLEVAGGGGGASLYEDNPYDVVNAGNGYNGSTTTLPNPATYGGSGEDGGGIFVVTLSNDYEYLSQGGGGAGYLGNGASNGNAKGGKDRVSAFAGGTGIDADGQGGYGGGGGHGEAGAGGGSGYNGGCGGYQDSNGVYHPGAGGGSYLNGTAISATAANIANGNVTILYNQLTYFNVSCNGGNNGSASAMPSGGTFPYSYSWSNGNTTSGISNLTAGNYTLTVTDAHNCSATASVTITQPDALNPIMVFSNISCSGANDGTAGIKSISGGTSPYTYLWSNGGTTNGLTGLSAGIYTLMVTDNAGCSTTESATITQPEDLVLPAPSVTNSSCNGGNSGIAVVYLSTNPTVVPFYYTGAMQTFTVPAGVTTATITVAGASGGNSDWYNGGAGASFTGMCPLQEGHTIAVVVGGEGGSTGISEGGGGGTFVYDATNSTPIAIAGGGGGCSYGINGVNGGTMVSSPYSATSGPGNGGTAGTGGNGGDGGSCSTYSNNGGAGGAGWLTNGFAGSSCQSGYGNAGGSDAANGFSGGVGDVGNNSPGGYGGGGGSGYYSGGGGGGYNGGGGGNDNYTSSGGGGGGGSYLYGTLVGNPSAANSGNGSATIKYITSGGGTPPYTYLWSGGGGTTNEATGLSAGTYTLTVTDSHGCTASVSATIQNAGLVIPAPIVSNASCSGNNGSAAVNLSPTNASFSYTGGLQTFTVPSGISVATITVTGGGGGGYGGYGASFTGICTLFPGHAISVAVGGKGVTGSFYGSGGGGGTFVFDATTVTPIAIAGGGGGQGYLDGTNAGTEVASPYSATDGIYGNGAGGTGGNGGYGGSCLYLGGAGGTGWFTNGAKGSSCESNLQNTGGSDEVYNFAGGTTSGFSGSAGGYGGGGGGGYESGGGGGGFNGGGGGNDNGYTGYGAGGGGGGSYLNGILSGVATTTNTGNGSATIQYYSAGGQTPYTYSWSGGGGTNSTATGLSSGTYTLTVTDNNGCIGTTSAIITQTAATLTANTTITNNEICDGGNSGSGNVSASGGTSPYTYSWSNGATSSAISNLIAGKYFITVFDSSGCNTTATLLISQPKQLGLSASVIANVSSYGGSDGSASSSPSNGTPPYTYSWSNGAQTQNISSVRAGVYTITILDNCGATDTASVTITQPNNPLAITISSQTNITCNGNSTGSAIANTATGGASPYTYSWSPSGGNNLTASNLSAGNYSIIVTDANSSTATAGVTISQPTQLAVSASVSANVLCNGGTGIATSIPSGGTTPYTYLWSGGGTTSGVSKTAGAYTITITDKNNCSATGSIIITQPTQISMNASVSANEICNGGTGIATSTPSGGTSPYTYSWSGGGTTSIVSKTAGVYTITVRDNHGCTATSSITITQPTAIALTSTTVNVSYCGNNNGSASLTPSGGTSPYTYKWGSNAGNKTTPIVSGLSVGTYTVNVTDGHGCSKTTSVVVSKASAITASINVSNIKCLGNNNGSAALIAAGGTSPYTYKWSNTQTASTISGLTAGTYTVKLTDAAGCTLTASANITQPATSLSASISNVTNVSCNGGNNGSARGNASGGTSPYTFSWSNSHTNSTATGLSVGTYSLTVTDKNGCTALGIVSITQPGTVVIATTQTNVTTHNGTNGKATASASGGTSPYIYRWSNSKTTAAITGLSAGIYSLTVTDKNGCTATKSVTITQPQHSPQQHDNDDSTTICCPVNESINLYPNPNAGVFTISGLESGMLIEIYDYTGRMIRNITIDNSTMQFNISDQPNGIYLIRIISKEGKLVSQKKIVKTR